MQELVKIETNEKQEPIVSARQLHEFLQLTERFQKWFDKQLDYGFIENQDFCPVKTFTQLNQHGGEKEIQDYALKLDMAKEISMIQRNAKGKEARQYFIQVEKEYTKKKVVSLTKKQELALRMFAGGADGLEAHQELVEIEKEEVRRIERNGTNKIINGGQVVEMLGISGLTPTILNNWMVSKGLGKWILFSGDKNKTFQPTESYLEYVTELGYSLTGTTNKGKVRMIYTTLFVDRIFDVHMSNLVQFVKSCNGEIIQEVV